MSDNDVDYSMSLIVLGCPMDPETNDAGASSVREFLAGIIREVWMHEDSFSGKRAFGSSGWKWDVYQALIDAKIVETGCGTWDSLSFDRRQVIDEWILGAVWLMGRGPRE